MRELVELLDALLKLRDCAAQPTDLLDQPLATSGTSVTWSDIAPESAPSNDLA